MLHEDRITISTPEGVELHYILAGLGSRSVAAIFDHILKFVLTIALIAATLGLGAAFSSAPDLLGDLGGGGGFVVAVFIVGLFAVQFVYDVLFETLASGRTPGKRLTGLRVVLLGGQSVGFKASAVRNLFRLVDGLPLAYGVGMVAVLISSKNQRLGDIVAGTLLVRERFEQVPQPVLELPSESAAAWDVSAIEPHELGAVRAFLGRRSSLDPEARGRLAWELAERLRPKVAGAPADAHPETFLEQLAAAKAARR